MNYSTLLQQIARRKITEAEMRVALLSLEGVNREAIAQQLYLCPGTVKVHLRSIYQKCAVSTQSELIAKALKLVTQVAA